MSLRPMINKTHYSQHNIEHHGNGINPARRTAGQDDFRRRGLVNSAEDVLLDIIALGDGFLNELGVCQSFFQGIAGADAGYRVLVIRISKQRCAFEKVQELHSLAVTIATDSFILVEQRNIKTFGRIECSPACANEARSDDSDSLDFADHW